jgi:arabinose-5-phosphate isomerase
MSIEDDAIALLRAEAAAILGLADSLGRSFAAAVVQISATTGRVIVSGLGKSWHVGQKISATMASTGTPSFSLHAGEARHGDLGRLVAGDTLLALSNSGETDELLTLAEAAVALGVPVISMTAGSDNSLARLATHTLVLGALKEAGPLNIAPTVTTTAMLALGDALAMGAAKIGGLKAEEYARYHPGGSIGRHLMTVRGLMRTGDAAPTATEDCTIRNALIAMSGARAGAIVVVQDSRVVGIFTDGDLRRSLGSQKSLLDAPLSQVMTKNPVTISCDRLATVALDELSSRQIDELVVVDKNGDFVGLLDLQDLVAAGIARG